MGFLEKIFGNYSEKEIKKIKPIVAKIEALGPQYLRIVWQRAKHWMIFCLRRMLW